MGRWRGGEVGGGEDECRGGEGKEGKREEDKLTLSSKTTTGQPSSSRRSELFALIQYLL